MATLVANESFDFICFDDRISSPFSIDQIKRFPLSFSIEDISHLHVSPTIFLVVQGHIVNFKRISIFNGLFVRSHFCLTKMHTTFYFISKIICWFVGFREEIGILVVFHNLNKNTIKWSEHFCYAWILDVDFVNISSHRF